MIEEAAFSRAHFHAIVNHMVTHHDEWTKDQMMIHHRNIMRDLGYKGADKLSEYVNNGRQVREVGHLPRMTRKDFRQVAQHLRTIPNEDVMHELGNHYMNVFRRSNALFGNEIFREAANLRRDYRPSNNKKPQKDFGF